MILNCKVITNSSKNQILGLESFYSVEEKPSILELRIYLTISPVQGKANKALIEMLSKEFKVPKGHISIVRGHTSNKKIINIDE